MHFLSRYVVLSHATGLIPYSSQPPLYTLDLAGDMYHVSSVVLFSIIRINSGHQTISVSHTPACNDGAFRER